MGCAFREAVSVVSFDSKVYCLPDGYEINDSSLDDIRHLPISVQLAIIYQSFQGELEVAKEIRRKGVSEKRENGDDRNMGIAVDGGAENDSIIREASREPFLMPGLDLPPPSFQGCNGEKYYSSGVLGFASKLTRANHASVWRNDSLAATTSSAMGAWVGMQRDKHRRAQVVEAKGVGSLHVQQQTRAGLEESGLRCWRPGYWRPGPQEWHHHVRLTP
ncbi:hypothetical protein Nepgr_029019 [Nepenthes gracilis]|uniref:Uncharacterized protein n=1 Tax=Nepenthes gracilis TaxID=150966 RepID=A0AAD3TDE7_NEPGR|nr:hypothetical protein Nepgr_029019 [Nepenthes gracilis]